MVKPYRNLIACGLVTAAVSVLAHQAMAGTDQIRLKLNNTVTVSGVSSGGFMANQFHIAHADKVSGAGIVAAGPYLCSEGNLMTAMKQCLADGAPLQQKDLTQSVKNAADKALIANPEDLKNDRVWLFHGTLDNRVGASVSDALHAQYQALLPEAQIQYVQDKPFNHGLPTTDFGVACSETSTPFINDCDYNAAKAMLDWLYPEQATDNSSPSTGQLYTIPQPTEVNGSATGLDKNAWLYVPEQCAAGEPCELHVSFHGCQQNYATIGTDYIANGGFNSQAEQKNLVLLYPQVAAGNPLNPLACWDWWGYTGANFAERSGAQITAITQLIDGLQSQPFTGEAQ